MLILSSVSPNPSLFSIPYICTCIRTTTTKQTKCVCQSTPLYYTLHMTKYNNVVKLHLMPCRGLGFDLPPTVQAQPSRTCTDARGHDTTIKRNELGRRTWKMDHASNRKYLKNNNMVYKLTLILGLILAILIALAMMLGINLRQ